MQMVVRGVWLCCREIVTGKPSPLNSSFKLSYYTLLNLMRRVEDAGHDQEYVIARSFNQFQFEQSLPLVRLTDLNCSGAKAGLQGMC